MHIFGSKNKDVGTMFFLWREIFLVIYLFCVLFLAVTEHNFVLNVLLLILTMWILKVKKKSFQISVVLPDTKCPPSKLVKILSDSDYYLVKSVSLSIFANRQFIESFVKRGENIIIHRYISLKCVVLNQILFLSHK